MYRTVEIRYNQHNKTKWNSNSTSDVGDRIELAISSAGNVTILVVAHAPTDDGNITSKDSARAED